MDNYYYSAGRNVFIAADSILLKTDDFNDAVAVSDDVFNEYFRTINDGKRRVAGSDGLPAWEDIPPPTTEEIQAAAIAEAEQKKSILKAVADSEIAWRQDAVDAEIATAEETAALSEWKKYRVLLMRVDTVNPVWPTPPGEQSS